MPIHRLLVLTLCLIAALRTTTYAQTDGDAAFRAGKRALDAHDADAAVREFARAVSAAARNAEYHYWLGVAYSMKASTGNFISKARNASTMRAEWERTVALDSTWYDAHEGLYQFYLQAPAIMGGSEDKARHERETMVHLRPYSAALYFAREDTKHQRYADVIAALTPVVREYPDSLAPALALVAALQDARRFTESWAALASAEAHFGARPQLAYAFGRGAALSGTQLDRGETLLRQLVAINPPGINVAGAHLRLGNILEHRGNRLEARAEYGAAAQLDPTSQAAQDALKRLAVR
jgi:tetratricopeptide (TPR) repeat protein